MTRTTTLWTFAITSIALFMVTLDNLVVTTAIPVIRVDLGASLESLEWTVNAYTLTFAVLLLTGAALGDRFGRRRMFAIGVGIFTLASVAAALAPSVEAAQRRAGRAGPRRRDRAAADADDPQRGRPGREARARARRVGRHRGLAVAFGPLVGGAVVEGISWQWIFWLNVPIGLLLIPLALTRLNESYGASTRLDLPGLGLASVGLFGIVWGLIRGNEQGWASPEIVDRARRRRGVHGRVRRLGAPRPQQPMLPMRFFRTAAFTLVEPRLAVHVLRHVRLDLPARAVLPDRAGLLAASAPGCGSCRGRWRRCSSRRSPARCPTGSRRS